jgi:hypothetical protein
VAPRFAVRRVEDVPRVPLDPGDPDWFPLTHHFGFTAFGANVYVARAGNADLLGDHDESKSEQEELYVVVAGEAAFTIEGERFDAPAVTVVAVPDPTVRRSAKAKVSGTTVVAIGGERRSAFTSSWQPYHFENVPTL